MQRKVLTPLIALTALFAAFSVSACNTVKGAGQDVQAAGNAVEGAATETQQDMQNNGH